MTTTMKDDLSKKIKNIEDDAIFEEFEEGGKIIYIYDYFANRLGG